MLSVSIGVFKIRKLETVLKTVKTGSSFSLTI